MNRNPWLRGRSTSRAQRVVLSVTATLFLASCSQVSVMRGNIDGLTKVAEQAERNGAIRCAPRELALAKSHLEFATVEIDQGFWTRAKEHLDIAEANAHAAYDLSPPQKCAERGFVEDAPPPKPGDKDGDGYLDPEGPVRPRARGQGRLPRRRRLSRARQRSRRHQGRQGQVQERPRRSRWLGGRGRLPRA